MNIDSKIIYDKKIDSYIYVYIMIIIIAMLSLIIVSMLFNYKTYIKLKATISKEEDNYYIKIYLPIDRNDILLNNNIVKIGKKDYKYKIVLIEDNYITDNNTAYQVAYLDINIPSKYKVNNLVLDIMLLKDNKKIINYILKEE